jgi:hypothetical protein
MNNVPPPTVVGVHLRRAPRGWPQATGRVSRPTTGAVTHATCFASERDGQIVLLGTPGMQQSCASGVVAARGRLDPEHGPGDDQDEPHGEEKGGDTLYDDAAHG